MNDVYNLIIDKKNEILSNSSLFSEEFASFISNDDNIQVLTSFIKKYPFVSSDDLYFKETEENINQKRCFLNAVKFILSYSSYDLALNGFVEEKFDDFVIDKYYTSFLCYVNSNSRCEDKASVLTIKSNLFDTRKIFELYKNVYDNIKEIESNNIDIYHMFNGNDKSINDDIFLFDSNEVTISSDFENEFVFDCIHIFLDFFYDFTEKTNRVDSLLKLIRLCNPIIKRIHLKKIELPSEIAQVIEQLDYTFITDINVFDFSRKLSLKQINDFVNIYKDILSDYVSFSNFNLLLDSNLTDREKELMEMRLSEKGYSLTYEALGKKFEISKQRVMQIEKKALSKIKAHFDGFSFFLDLLNKLSFYKHISFCSELVSANYPAIFYKYFVFIDLVKEIFNGDIIISNCYYKYSLGLFDKLPNKFIHDDIDVLIQQLLNDGEFVFDYDETKEILVRFYTKYENLYLKQKPTAKDVICYLLPTLFPNGISVYDTADLDILRKKASEVFDGFEFSSDRALSSRIQDCCHLTGRGVWSYGKSDCLIDESLQKKIIEYIELQDNPIILIRHLYNHFIDYLLECGINNHYHFQGQLKLFICDYKISRDYVVKDASCSFYTLVEDYIRDKKHLVSREEVYKEFPGLSDTIMSAICQCTGVINMNGFYAHIDNMNISIESKNYILSLLKNYIKPGIVYNTREIFDNLKDSLNEIFYVLDITHYSQFYYLINKLYPDSFEYARPFIGQKGITIKPGEVQLVEKLHEIGKCSISEIRDNAKKIGVFLDSYIQFVDRNKDSIMFASREEICSCDYAFYDNLRFDDLDIVISNYMNNDQYKLLHYFPLYSILPTIKVQWNKWVLYSVINKYSSKFKVVVSSNTLAIAEPIVLEKEYDCAKIDFEIIKNLDGEKIDNYLDFDELLDLDDLV